MSVAFFLDGRERPEYFVAERSHERVLHKPRFHLVARAEGNSNPYVNLRFGSHLKQYLGGVELSSLF
jgi:hypothetical protein